MGTCEEAAGTSDDAGILPLWGGAPPREPSSDSTHPDSEERPRQWRDQDLGRSASERLFWVGGGKPCGGCLRLGGGQVHCAGSRGSTIATGRIIATTCFDLLVSGKQV